MDAPAQNARPEAAGVSVIITCRRQPRELDLALAGVLRQTRAPLEVLIADAGSGPRTHDVVAHWRARAAMPLHHVRPATGGAAQTLALDQAIERAQGEHLLFLDGGCFPHRNWLSDHLAGACDRTVRFGSGVELGPRLSPSITRDDIEGGRFDGPLSPLLVKSRLAGDTKRIAAGVRLPRSLSWILGRSGLARAPMNVSLPREACMQTRVAALGRDASNREARALEADLERLGYRPTSLRHRAVVFVLGGEDPALSTPAGELQPGTAISR